jgi:Holliday junction resolvase-like predicted endonuclease
MYSRSDYYRRRAIQARQQATQAIDPSSQANLENAADHWVALAEQVEWLEEKSGHFHNVKTYWFAQLE